MFFSHQNRYHLSSDCSPTSQNVGPYICRMDLSVFEAFAYVKGHSTKTDDVRTFQDLPDSDSIFRPDLLDLLSAYEDNDASYNWSA